MIKEYIQSYLQSYPIQIKSLPISIKIQTQISKSSIKYQRVNPMHNHHKFNVDNIGTHQMKLPKSQSHINKKLYKKCENYLTSSTSIIKDINYGTSSASM